MAGNPINTFRTTQRWLFSERFVHHGNSHTEQARCI